MTQKKKIVKTFIQNDPANNAECVPGGRAGNYIMFGGANTGEKVNNRRFSPCSRSKINAVMNFKGRCPDSICCFKGTMFMSSFCYCLLSVPSVLGIVNSWAQITTVRLRTVAGGNRCKPPSCMECETSQKSSLNVKLKPMNPTTRRRLRGDLVTQHFMAKRF